MEIGKTFCGRTDVRTYGRTDGRTHLSTNLLGHRRGDDLKIKIHAQGGVAVCARKLTSAGSSETFGRLRLRCCRCSITLLTSSCTCCCSCGFNTFTYAANPSLTTSSNSQPYKRSTLTRFSWPLNAQSVNEHKTAAKMAKHFHNTLSTTTEGSLGDLATDQCTTQMNLQANSCENDCV